MTNTLGNKQFEKHQSTQKASSYFGMLCVLLVLHFQLLIEVLQNSR
jgi:hypothetical protein